jgi:alpha-galactosidase
MSAEDWLRFEALVVEASTGTPILARAYGEAISRLMNAQHSPVPGPTHWMDWERRKTLRLLRAAY